MRRGILENMPTNSLRLSQETQGTVTGEGRRAIIKLPEGSEIALIGQVAEHPEMVEITWNAQSVWIFAIDFEARTKDDAHLLTRATSVGAGSPEPKPDINVNVRTEAPANIVQKTVPTPRVRRFNSAGRELF